MSQIAQSGSAASGAPAAVPAPLVPRCDLAVRPATVKDLPFLDALQKMHTHMVGWFPSKQMQAYVEAGHVLIAEEANAGVGVRVGVGVGSEQTNHPTHTPNPTPTRPSSSPTPLGYCIARDQYGGREDVGIVYQLNVAPLKQRHLVGAMLIKATFERAAYGCRLFSCWCAQDIQANYFWEALGFIPLAFRTGSRSKQRVHIFWQRRIREDDTITPWWFPSKTAGGAVREDRLVFPIPPGTYWRDVQPIVLPGMQQEVQVQPKTLPPSRPKQEKRVLKAPVVHPHNCPPGKIAVVTASGMKYIDRADYVPEPEPVPEPKPKRPPAPKIDPELIAATRELRDRVLEQINTPGNAPLPECKYNVARQIGQSVTVQPAPAAPKQLPQAA